MLKYIYIGLISLLLAGVLNSCYEDKGNYSYNWVQDIDLTEVLKDTTVGRGHVLYLEVDLKNKFWERRVRLRSLIRRIILSNGRLSRVMEMWC